MKVLITGGYGFIGSHIADRFHKEGYEIFILDNLSTGNKDNITYKHRSYIIDVADKKCEDIFKAHRFDVVVHMAAQVSVQQSLVDPQLDTKSNVVGMVNMLKHASAYGVKRFIYASSAAVYGQLDELPLTENHNANPVSPYGMSKLMNELYGKKWSELYQISTLGFRFSNVYGPRQNHSGEGGVVSIFINDVLSKKPLNIFGNGEQTRDFIYVEDVADAIYRSINTEVTGVYNLSTNLSVSINELAAQVQQYDPSITINYLAPRSNDIVHSRLDNSEIMRKIDWSPMYDIQSGLERTYEYFSEHKAKIEATTTKGKEDAIVLEKKKKRKANRWMISTVENLLAFALTAWLSLNIITNMYGVIDVKLFYITIIGILYGNRQSLLAVLLSVGLLTYQELQIGRDIISLTYDTDFFFQVAIYLFVGLVVGYTIQRMKNRIAQQEQQRQELSERYEFLEHIYQDVREVKEELQERILNANDSYGKIYNATKELESLEPEIVFNAAVNVVKTILVVPKVSIYRVNEYQSYLRLLASSGYSDVELQKSLRVSEHIYLQEVIATGKIYTNKQLESNIPLMIAPIYYNDKIAAIICIDGLSFEYFSLYYQNLFQITTNLIASALKKAFSYIEATEKMRYVDKTNILRPEVFHDIINSKNHVKEEHKVPYLLIDVELNDDLPIENISSHINSLLRETDYIGQNSAGQLQILLSNTTELDFGIINQRLHHPAITLSIQSGG